ncbi:MAG: glycosyltransferase [Lachnospiraceae bacterium]|nr:glycosyltransferase [Lachnospiraceae bacterium]
MRDEKMSYVIIGNPDSIWIKKYIEKVILQKDEYKIYIIDLGERKEGIYKKYYDDNGVEIVRIPKRKIQKLPLIGSWLYSHTVARYIKKTISPDVIHAHFITWQSVCMLAQLKEHHNIVIATYWGSDILRETRLKLLLSELWLGKVDKITLATTEMRSKFNRFYKGKYEEKVFPLIFGVNGFEYLDRMDHNSDYYKPFYGIPKANITITVGYNGARGQQQIEVLKAIDRLSVTVKKKIFVIVPMTYGVPSDTYIEEIDSYLNKMNISGYAILKQYMDDEISARLKCVTDLFVHAQVTDAFSASVQEFLYAEKLVLNPSWIRYDELLKKGVFFLTYDSFDTLDKCLESAIEAFLCEKYKRKLEQNMEILHDFTSWEAVTSNWRVLYKDVRP